MMVRVMTKELEEKARKELNEDHRRDDYVQELKVWMKTNYEREIIGDMWLLNYLRGCKFDRERTKDKLQKFYAAKSTMTLLFDNRDPFSTNIQDVIRSGILLPLYSEDKEIILVRWANCDTSKVTLLNVVKVGLMLLEMFMHECRTCMIVGHYVIIDCSGLPFSFITQVSPSLIKNIVYVLFRTYPTRIKGIFVINCFALTQIFYNIFKPFLQKKIISRIHFYSSNNFNEISKHVPLSVFPREYGGDSGSISNIVDNVKNSLEQRRRWYLKDRH
ncbi:hypothetical protein RN001_008861 [Aquatica leii]|uniref:CRAL-TRIO domain-containing protein n=1 Tax=Aquatica leii TaxID=1421715 RepID=A0AAN7Q5G3_9COLE|nr:hypothetical protein RN001_008861 [Aquatica leii]